jgi:nitric oxide reductase large subunit
MNEKYDKSKELIFIEYVDANNLYGHAQIDYLPYNVYRWSSKDINVLSILDDS